jgi:hypothetical protein
MYGVLQTASGAHPAFYTMTLPGSEAQAEPKNAWSYTSTPVYFTVYSLIKNTENFIFTSKRPTEYNARYISNFVGQLVEALCYKSEGRGFDFQ